jgi:hypothetical protein
MILGRITHRRRCCCDRSTPRADEGGGPPLSGKAQHRPRVASQASVATAEVSRPREAARSRQDECRKDQRAESGLEKQPQGSRRGIFRKPLPTKQSSTRRIHPRVAKTEPRKACRVVSPIPRKQESRSVLGKPAPVGSMTEQASQSLAFFRQMSDEKLAAEFSGRPRSRPRTFGDWR